MDDGFWICACLKRDRSGRQTHIKGNAPHVARCRRCGVTREESLAVARESGKVRADDARRAREFREERDGKR